MRSLHLAHRRAILAVALCCTVLAPVATTAWAEYEPGVEAAPGETEAATDAGVVTGDAEELAARLSSGELALREVASTVESAEDEGAEADDRLAESTEDYADELAIRSFAMPDGAEYDPGMILVLVDQGADCEELTTYLASVPGLAEHVVTPEEVELGIVEVPLEDGVAVEDAVNAVLATMRGPVTGAQPNYLYTFMGEGDASDLRALTEPALVDASEDVGDDGVGDGVAGQDGGASALLSQAEVAVNDPGVSHQWALASMRVFEAWALARCDNKVTVAVVDGGMDIGHEDLSENVLSDLAFNAVTGVVGPVAVEPDSALRDHATHVAGIIAARANNNIGVAGISYNANILPIKVFNGASASTGSVVRAYSYVMSLAKSQNVKVINLSVGMRDKDVLSENDAAMLTWIRKAYDEANIVTVAAAGNAALAPVPYAIYPGDYSPVVSVINLIRSGTGVERAVGSNYNATDDHLKNISAPGTDIYATTPYTRSYANMSGTSMAAPCVAGVLALEYAAKPDLTAANAVSILYGSATDLGAAGWDRNFGNGEANAYAAAYEARGGAAQSDISGASVKLEQTSYIYDGKPKKPGVTVTMGTVILVEGTDYSVSYANNVKVGTATVTIKAVGAYYTGTVTRKFRIAQNSVADATITLDKATLTYTGDALRPSVTVSNGSATLKEGTDYVLTYVDNVEAGTGRVVVAGAGSYIGTVSKSFTISRRSLGDAEVSVSPESVTFTGASIQPTVSVTFRDRALVEGTDFDVSYEGNTYVGTARVTVAGKGNFVNAVTKDFVIVEGSAVWRRLSGQTALDTMAVIVGEGGFAKRGTVVLATTDGYWDALTAAGVAGLAGAPIVMTAGKELSPQAADRIADLMPQRIVVCGGSLSVSDATVAAASQAAGGVETVRIAGEDAIGTADQLFARAAEVSTTPWSDVAFVCSGDGYWDALSAAPLAYALHAPIFLTHAESLEASTLEAIRQGGFATVYVVGGTLSVSDAVMAQLTAAGVTVGGRLAGETAIETSSAVAEYGLTRGMVANLMGVASSDGYWDALAGSALCGRNGSVLVLVGGPTSTSISGFIATHKAEIANGIVFGGTKSVSDKSFEAVTRASA